jgi:hypothetical protein
MTFFAIHNSATQRQVGILLVNDSIQNITAANVTRFLWLFLADGDVNPRDIILFLRSIEEYKDRTIQIMVGEGGEGPTGGWSTEDEVPAFWTFTGKDELGPVISSIHRSVYAVLRKYGHIDLSELARVV